MKEIFCGNLEKIKKNKNKIEKILKIKLSFQENKVCIDGDAISEYLCLEIIEALELGFTSEQALLLQDEDFVFEKIHIKELTKRHDLERIRGRIIGSKGKTKKNIQSLSDCFICLHDNIVGIIGRADDIGSAIRALESLIQGKRTENVYSYLERQRTRKKEQKRKQGFKEDLGLKIRNKNKKSKE